MIPPFRTEIVYKINPGGTVHFTNPDVYIGPIERGFKWPNSTASDAGGLKLPETDRRRLYFGPERGAESDLSGGLPLLPPLSGGRYVAAGEGCPAGVRAHN